MSAQFLRSTPGWRLLAAFALLGLGWVPHTHAAPHRRDIHQPPLAAALE